MVNVINPWSQPHFTHSNHKTKANEKCCVSKIPGQRQMTKPEETHTRPEYDAAEKLFNSLPMNYFQTRLNSPLKMRNFFIIIV